MSGGILQIKGDILTRDGGKAVRHAVPAVNGQPLIADPSTSDGWIADHPSSRREVYLRPTGAIAETISRAHGALTGQAATVSGTLYAVGIVLPANRLISSITFVSASTALAGGSNQWFALVDNALNVLGKTVDDGATAWAGNAAKTLALSAPFTTTYSGLHYICPLIVATTMPTWTGIADSSSVMGLIAPAAAGTSTAGLTNPASLGSTIAALGGVANKRIWGWVS